MFGFQKRLEKLKSAADGCLNQPCDSDSVTPSTPEPASSKSRRTTTLEHKSHQPPDATYPLILRPISKSSTTPPEICEFVVSCLRDNYEIVPNDGRFVDEVHFFNHQKGCFVIAMFGSKMMAELFVGIGSLVVSTCPFVPQGCQLTLLMDPNTRTFEKIRLRDAKKIYLHGVPSEWADAERLKSYFDTVVLKGLESDFGLELVKQVQLLPGAAFIGFRHKAVVDMVFYRCGKDKQLLTAVSQDSKLVRFISRKKGARVEAAQAKPPVRATSVGDNQATPAAAQRGKLADKAVDEPSLVSSLQATRVSTGAKKVDESDVQVASEGAQSATTRPAQHAAVGAAKTVNAVVNGQVSSWITVTEVHSDIQLNSLEVERSEWQQKGHAHGSEHVSPSKSATNHSEATVITKSTAVGQEERVDLQVVQVKTSSKVTRLSPRNSEVTIQLNCTPPGGPGILRKESVQSRNEQDEERKSKKSKGLWDQQTPKSTRVSQSSVFLTNFDVHFCSQSAQAWFREILLKERPGRDVSLRILWQKGAPEAQLLLGSEDMADTLMDAYVNDTERFCKDGLPMQLTRHKLYVRPGAVYTQSRTTAVVRDVTLHGLAGARLYPEQLRGAVSELLERTLLTEGLLDRGQSLVKGIMFVPGSHVAMIALEEPVAHRLLSTTSTLKLAGRILHLTLVQNCQSTLQCPFMPTSIAQYDVEGFKFFLRSMLKRVRPNEPVADSIKEIKWVVGHWKAEVILQTEALADALMDAFLQYTPEFQLGGAPFAVYRAKNYIRPGVCYRKDVSPSADQQLLFLGIEKSLDPRQVKACLHELLSRALVGEGVLEYQGNLLKSVFFRPGDTCAYVKVDDIVAWKLQHQWTPLKLAGSVITLLPQNTPAAAPQAPTAPPPPPPPPPPPKPPQLGSGGWIELPTPSGGWIEEPEVEDGEISYLEQCIRATLTSLN